LILFLLLTLLVLFSLIIPAKSKRCDKAQKKQQKRQRHGYFLLQARLSSHQEFC
jgi:hypothetical protein